MAGNLQITTHIDIPYVQWGLKNPSNFLLRVSDNVTIEIQATGRVNPAELAVIPWDRLPACWS